MQVTITVERRHIEQYSAWLDSNRMIEYTSNPTGKITCNCAVANALNEKNPYMYSVHTDTVMKNDNNNQTKLPDNLVSFIQYIDSIGPKKFLEQVPFISRKFVLDLPE